MRLALQDLCSMHPKLRGHPTDYARHGALALQRAGHNSPVLAGVDHDGLAGTAEINWLFQDLKVLAVLDRHRVTEDGAEAVALAYANSKAGSVVKRRIQRGESADWMMRNESGCLVLEVSGTTVGNPSARLEEKKRQVARCSLPAKLLAIVVAFDRPLILASGI